MKTEVKTIAFYLPQYHPIPENDKAYGKGFTEWTNVKKAKPLFENHYQPRIPYNSDYYSLLDLDTMKRQITLAKENGIYGFCYYHYWFTGGIKLLEKPIERMLKHPELDMPFCLCWANENWTKKWDGGNNEIIVKQSYGNEEDLDNHVDYLCDFFKDERYIKIDGMPLLIIYRPNLIPKIRNVIHRIRERVKQNGFKGVKIAIQHPQYYVEGVNLQLFDYYIQFQPLFVQIDNREKEMSRFLHMIKKTLIRFGMKGLRNLLGELKNKYICSHEDTLVHRNYDEDWEKILSYKSSDKKLIAGAFVDWDNTPRNRNGLVYDGASPEKFGIYFKRLVKKVEREYDEKFIFINAWNEWAEGAYLEPDEKYGYNYLDKLKQAINN